MKPTPVCLSIVCTQVCAGTDLGVHFLNINVAIVLLASDSDAEPATDGDSTSSGHFPSGVVKKLAISF